MSPFKILLCTLLLSNALAAAHAEPVYNLFGLKGLATMEMPAPEKPILSGHVGYHIRSGKHDLTDYDWDQYLNFGDKHLK